jgi:hypothetical protein
MFYYHANLVPFWNRPESITDGEPVGAEFAAAVSEPSQGGLKGGLKGGLEAR